MNFSTFLGWLHTGDLGHYNEDGELFITDRLKEIMKYRGHHVSSSEIEQILLDHPAVMDVAVVPIPHDIDNERPMALVKKVPDAQVRAHKYFTQCNIDKSITILMLSSIRLPKKN